MSNVRTTLVALLGVAACGGSDSSKQVDAGTQTADAPADAKVFEDAPAPTYDFSCKSSSAPTTAATSITLSGTVQHLDLVGTTPSATPVDGSVVKVCTDGSLCINAMSGERARAYSDATGAFALGPIDNAPNPAPLDVFLRMASGNVRTTLVYPPSPWIADQANIPILSLSSNVMTALGVACGHSDTGNGLVAVAITDCANKPITDTQNVKITITQNGAAVPTVSVFDLGGLSSQFAGTFFVCSVPANSTSFLGATTISAAYKGMPMLDVLVRIQQGGTTATVVRPGY
jgi:hypothetical protein